MMLFDEIRPKLKVHKGVYKPLLEAKMMSGLVERYARGKVLDLGTGTGIQGIIAAMKGCDVTFSDIKPEAVECARANARSLGLGGRFVVSDIFSKISGKYNLITFNIPYLASDSIDSGTTEPNTDGGIGGRELIDRFLGSYKRYVAKDHDVLMSESYWNHYENDVKRLHAEVAAKKHYPLLGDIVILRFK